MANTEQINAALKMLEDGLAATLKGNALSDDSKRVYALMLATTPADVLQGAVLLLLSKETWFPTPAKILEACRDVQLAAQPKHDWEQGYMYCRRACRYFGTGQGESAAAKIEEYDAIAAQTIRRLGWDSFFMCPEADEGIFKAQFRDIYNTVVKREQSALSLPAHVSSQIMQVSAAMSATNRLAAPRK